MLFQALLRLLMNKIALWNSMRANDWTAKTAIIASNDKSKRKNMTFSRMMDIHND